ncbi:hypothetical protein [Undibacterium fentianense]|uniref:Uncharacterized protein n=1 Tax=Undibacterium fentianense TaxID=2828728 RepID=A0A941E2K2_9BURK|nr:hypothetical protein [Undibacterium fentianense]MBR7798523.1 hypothetical protein [Undibacterium fentianense]
MRKISLLIAGLVLPIALASAQSNIKLSTIEGVENEDLMNVLRFQGISYSKVKFSGTHLWGKDFKILIRDFSKGKLVKTYEIFDSKEDEFFKLKEQEFTFNVLVQRTAAGKAKFDFRFLGYGAVKEFDLSPDQKDFTLKSLQGGATEIEFPVGQNRSILSFMMPYKAKNGSIQYPDVNQSDLIPEDFGKKYNIPRYFLIDIRFD